MKKFYSFVLAISILAASAFSYNWFDKRYFELAVETPFGLSNNTLQLNDILTKNLVIDLRELADRVPNDGFDVSFYTNPTVSFNLDARKFQVSLKTGVESSGKAGISKDLFEYIGHGNSLYETISISQKANLDVFVYEEIAVGFKIKDFKIVAKPCFFIPVIHAGSSNGSLTMKNLEDGTFDVNYSSDIEIYSAVDVNDKFKGLKAGLGFDFAASVSYPLFDFLELTGNARIPIVPGQLNYKTVRTTTLSFTTSMDRIINGDSGSKDFDSTSSDTETVSYKINRPLKLGVSADYTPFGKWLIFKGGLGMGFRHPFTDDKDSFEFFPEYYLGSTLDLLNILKTTLSTQYYEQLFIHQFEVSLNARILELVFAINAQASDFIRSCSGGGVGGFVAVKIGY